MVVQLLPNVPEIPVEIAPEVVTLSSRVNPEGQAVDLLTGNWSVLSEKIPVGQPDPNVGPL